MHNAKYLIPDRPIAFNRDFVSLDIGVTGALLLSQAIYWSKRTSEGDGWFWKTQEQWQDESGLTRTEQETARKRLRALGVLYEERKGTPAKLWFYVDMQKLAELLQSSVQESCTPVCRKPAIKNAGNLQHTIHRVHTESTTETTSVYSDPKFLKFWEEYPNKTAKGSAWKSWQKLKVTDELNGKILKSLEMHIASRQWTADDGRYIPHPATFLNQRRWEDEVQGFSKEKQRVKTKYEGL